ncbi:putative hydrolase of the HAD superfamily [Reichenbachiella faecimaris]|uniref:Putative hydrolase of the HAD superfamily n=1 Tax=Reichenbachiella faecimaris TaxID=692418 RepID=A0A1W2G827_REIFA|nr:HAD family hydrolase [Reichenbachiella faecimaris]SMD32654.1 putative hydrolase of the HAD superfamily [Reichenbachiella faecimaris]
MQTKIIAFDADDTLWHNESYFRETEKKFYALLEGYMPEHSLAKELFQVEMQNLELYGYGIKAFTLSMIESAMQISERTIEIEDIEKIITYGKELLQMPVELIDEVESVLQALYGKYKLVLATKGDLLDQHRKLTKSGLGKYFHHIEIMSEKKVLDYEKLLRRLEIEPQQFVMIGNSLKSDVLPVLELGGTAFHIPYHVTWAHEHVDRDIEHENFHSIDKITKLLEFIS